MLVGTLGAMKQQNIKRFMGYSSISHIGFILIGVVSSISFGILALELYIIIYIIMSIIIFGALLSSKINEKEIEDIAQFQGLGTNHKVLAASLVIVLFSLAGIPPLAGFFSKLLILCSAILDGLFSLAIIAVTFSVIATFYYVRFIKEFYFMLPLR